MIDFLYFSQKIGRENDPSKEKQESPNIQDCSLVPRAFPFKGNAKLYQWPFAIIVHFTNQRARSMYDVAREFVSSNDAQKQLARNYLYTQLSFFSGVVTSECNGIDARDFVVSWQRWMTFRCFSVKLIVFLVLACRLRWLIF